MNRIEPESLWIGHGGEETDLTPIYDRGIEALVVLAEEEPPFRTARDLITVRIPLIDGAGNPPARLDLAVGIVTALLQTRVPTLVCCSAGMSRAPAVAAAALARLRSGPLAGWLERVAAHHPSDVSPGLWADIVATEAARPSLLD